MTNDTTTIEITTEQKAQLDNLKATGQAYKHIMSEIIDSYSNKESEAIESYSGNVRDVLNRLDDLETHLDGRLDEMTRP
jgi:predicted DNA-binding protein